MKIEIGNVYKCGGRFVEIVSKIEKTSNFYHMPYIAICCNEDGSYIGAPDECRTGRFDREGDYSSANPRGMKSSLKEIEEDVEEMTMTQVNKELGRKVKIIEEEG